MPRAVRNAFRSQGQDIVEMALILPLLLALLLGIAEFGVAVWRYNTVANAAREGARRGVVAGCDSAQIQAAAERLMVGLVPPPAVTSGVSAGVCTVSVDYTHSLITAGFFETFGVAPSFDLRATSSMTIE